MEKIDTLVKLKKLMSEGKEVKVIYDSFYCDTLEDSHMTECLNDVETPLKNGSVFSNIYIEDMWMLILDDYERKSKNV